MEWKILKITLDAVVSTLITSVQAAEAGIGNLFGVTISPYGIIWVGDRVNLKI